MNRKPIYTTTLSIVILLTLVFIIGELSSQNTTSLTTTLDNISVTTQTAALGDLTSGLVAHYTFDDASNLGADSSGNGNNGTPVNGPTATTGKVGNGAVQMDGVDDYINIPDSASLSPTNTATVSVWFKTNTAPGSSCKYLLNKANSFGLCISGSGATVLNLTIRGGLTTDNMSISVPAFNNDSWHNFVGVFDGSTLSIYFDGILKVNRATTRTSIDHSSSPLIVGSTAATGGFYKGILDDVRIYSRALTPDEITQLYALGGSTPPPPPPPSDTPINGSCSTTVNTCTAGTFSDITDTSTNYLWSCIGTSGGTTASCSSPIPTTPPAGDTTPPVITNTTPSSYTAGTTQATLSVSTNENATCKYSTTANTTYTSIENTMNGADSTSHTATISNLSNGTTYTYYIRCKDSATTPNTNTSDTTITFSINSPVTPPPAGAQVIGREALVELPSSALYSSIINFKPGNNELVTTNPPRFSWPYWPDPSDPFYGYCGNGITCPKWAPYQFIFQISDSSQFTNPILNVRTSSNSYNFIPALTPGRRYYWRVGYIPPANINDSKTWTLGPNSWASSPSVWSGTRQFVVSTNSQIWDRSMFSNEAYLANKGSHPHMLFNLSNRKDLYEFVKNRPEWVAFKKNAESTISAAWWPNDKPSSGWIGNWPNQIANAAFVYQLGQEAPAGSTDRLLSERILASHPQNAIVAYVRYFMDSNGTITDTISQQEFIGGIKFTSFVYDWLYDLFDSDQKQVVLHAMELRTQCMIKGYFYFWLTPKQYGGCDPTGEYIGNGFRVMTSSMFVYSHSHTIDNFNTSLFFPLSCFADSQICREGFDLGMNYIMGVTNFAGNSETGLSEGKGYGSGKLFWGTGDSLYTHIVAAIQFPEAHLERNPFWHQVADAWDHFIPVGQIQGNDPFSDSGWGDLSFTYESLTWGRDLSYFINDPVTYQHYRNQLNLDIFANNRTTDSFASIPVGFYYPVPSQTDSSRSSMFPYDGYVMACSKPSNTPGCFADGIGFTLQSRPRGASIGHSPWSDLSFEMWAYGTTFTEGGTQGIDQGYGYHPINRNSLFVDGRGPVPMVAFKPFYSRIIGYKTTSNYVYASVDATNAFPVTPSKYYSVYTEPYSRLSPPYTQNTLSYLQKVRRHLLFIKDKYFVVFDDLQSSQLAQYSWLYNILENTLSLNSADASFSYTSNIKKFVAANVLQNRVDKVPGPDVTIYVKHVGNPDFLTVTDMSGSNVVSNPFTTENFYTVQSKYNPNIRAHSIWVSNKDKSNAFHFLTVIYPKNPADDTAGKPDPKIERLDDYTAKVTNPDGTVDVISFNNNPQATIAVDLSQLTPLPVVDDVTGTTVTSVPYVPPPSNPPPTTPPSTTLPGDFDHNNIVNSLDLSLLTSKWNQSNTAFDLTGDGLVNTLDYVVMVKNWTR